MNDVFWILVVGIAGWLTGKIVGGRGYGESLAGNTTDMLDFFLGIVGASVAGYLFSGAVIGEGGSFGGYATPILGSITLVWVARLVLTKCMLANLRKG